ncbi:MAG TPA: thiamine phosphate synthase [Pyrinomonadaceae bacterium]|nr:thiamine phosphate synthase [Pyrinomonadaceae bacterium]
MAFHLPRVYPITDTNLSGLSHAEQIDRLIAGGATLIQLRDKRAAPGDFYRQAKAALQIARKHNVRLIINDRVDIALALGADGVHLGQTDMPVAAARRLLGESAIVGISTHNLVQAELAANMPVDYVAFGPIFQTSTKDNPDPIAGLGALRSVRTIVGALPVVAIGGVTLANSEEAWRAGADAVSSIAALVSNPSRIREHMHQMLAKSHAATRK